MRRLIAIFALAALTSACAAEIGDECSADVECSPDMNRNCDRSQPGGYCLIIGCGPDECPSESVCVEFTTPCPTGEPYMEDAGPDGGESKCGLIEPNRGRRYCLRHCGSDGDCRSKYMCLDPTEFSAAIIEFESKHTKVCVPDE